MLQVETVGYRLENKPFTLAADGVLTFEIVLSPDTFRRADSVEVRAGVFEVPGVSTQSELALTGAEIKNLGTVLLDDPMRAVHALPGVGSNNDFDSRFSLRGAPFERLGFYLDDVLMHAPLHAIAATQTDASLTILNGEMVSDITLLPSAFPARYSDRTAGVLDVRTREGSRTKPSLRIAGGVTSTTALAEGPWAKQRGSWIVSVRKSYLQYLLNRLTSDSALAVGFTDVQGRASYDLTQRNSVSLYALNGTTTLDRRQAISRSGANALIDGRTRSSLARAGWQYAGTAWVLNAAGAWTRERFTSLNKKDQPLDAGGYGEWQGVVRATWFEAGGNSLEAGWSIRRLRADGSSYQYFNDPSLLRTLDLYRGTALRDGGFVEQSWSLRGGLLRGGAGVRFDRHTLHDGVVASPVASLAWRVNRAAELQLGWGQYVQFPELAQITSIWGGRRLLPERANHYQAALEWRLSGDSRLRVEAWNRDDRDLVSRPFYDPRVIGEGVAPPGDAGLFNAVRGYSRGLQVLLQRRNANRLSGWIGYTYGYARLRDPVEGRYWSPQDQRHLVNLYWSYRLRPSLNLSGRWGYGSGEPIPGYFLEQPPLYFLTSTRNDTRLPAYHRLDLRASKSVRYNRWKITIYGELINLTNRNNLHFVSFDGVNPVTRQVRLTIDRMFPILPVGGVTLEF